MSKKIVNKRKCPNCGSKTKVSFAFGKEEDIYEFVVYVCGSKDSLHFHSPDICTLSEECKTIGNRNELLNELLNEK